MYPIYISRRCQNCQELIITLHKHTSLRNRFRVIDIDTNPFPNYLKVVPTMVLDDSLLLGEELFKYIHGLLDKLTNRVTPPLENSSKPRPSELDSREKETEKEKEGEVDGYSLDGTCNLTFASLEEDEYIDQRNFFEELECDDSSPPEELLENTSEKHRQVADDYEKMMKERNELNIQ